MYFARKNPILGAVAYNILFGLAYLPLKVLTERLTGDASLLIALRFGTCLLILEIFKGLGLIQFRRFRALGCTVLPICLFQLLNSGFETLGIQFYPSGKASVILALIPLISTLLAIPVFREKPSRGQLAFILTGFCGVVLVNSGGGDGQTTVFGFLMLLLAATMSSMLNLSIRRYGQELSPMEVTYAMACAMFGVYAPVALTHHAVSGTLRQIILPLGDPLVIACLLFLAAGSSLYAAALRNIVLTRMPMATASSFSGISTVTAIVVGVIVLGEPFGPQEIFGSFLVLLGVWGVNALAHRSRLRLARHIR